MNRDLELLKDMGDALPAIDLHHAGSVNEALTKLDQEMTRLSLSHVNACRVIYGIGEGVMRKAVLQELGRHPLVRGVVEESSGGSAVVGL